MNGTSTARTGGLSFVASVTAAAMALCSCAGPEAVPVEAKTERLRVFWGLLGAYPSEDHLNPYKLTRDDKTVDSGALLFSIRRESKSPSRIAAESGIPLGDVERKLAELEDCALVAETSGGYAIRFPFWDAQLRDEINALGGEIAIDVARRVKRELPRLKEAYARSTLPGQGYSWERVSRIVVGGLLLDTGLNDRGLRKRSFFDPEEHTPVRPGGYRYWFKAVEDSWGPFWKFGHDQTYNRNGTGFAQFYGQKHGYRIDWAKAADVHDADVRDVVLALIENGSFEVASLAKELGLSESDVPELLDKLVSAEIVRLDGGHLVPGFPVFNQDDIDSILATVDAVCDSIIEDVYVPHIPRIEERWREIGPKSWRIESVDRFFVREVLDRSYNLTLDLLIEEETLPRPLAEPPFDYWGLLGRYEVL